MIQGAALAGAGRILAVDTNPAKLDAVQIYGATDAIPADGDAGKAIRKLTGGRGVDFAFVSVGSPAAIESAARWLAPGGALVVVGMPPSGSTVAYDPTRLVSLNLRILGARMGRAVLARDIPWLIGHWRAGRLKLSELISGRYPLEGINEAIADAKSGASIRNVIVFGDAR